MNWWSRQVACSWWKPYSQSVLEQHSAPPVQRLHQGEPLLNYVEVYSRWWQWDMVTGVPNGPLWSNSPFMGCTVSYVVDSYQWTLVFDFMYLSLGWFSLCPRASKWDHETNRRPLWLFLRVWDVSIFILGVLYLWCACESLRRAFCGQLMQHVWWQFKARPYWYSFPYTHIQRMSALHNSW